MLITIGYILLAFVVIYIIGRLIEVIGLQYIEQALKEKKKYRTVYHCMKCAERVTQEEKWEKFCPHCHTPGKLLFMDVYESYEDGYGKTKRENERE